MVSPCRRKSWCLHVLKSSLPPRVRLGGTWFWGWGRGGRGRGAPSFPRSSLEKHAGFRETASSARGSDSGFGSGPLHSPAPALGFDSAPNAGSVAPVAINGFCNAPPSPHSPPAPPPARTLARVVAPWSSPVTIGYRRRRPCVAPVVRGDIVLGQIAMGSVVASHPGQSQFLHQPVLM